MSGDDLFSMADERSGREYAPLAVRMRPESLDDVYGQDELIGPGSFLRMMIERDTIPSLLFYGPSGVGKTTLAHVIATETDSRFVTLNAVTAGTAELRKVIAAAKEAVHLYQKRTILFIDEIHRLPKTVEEILYSAMEDYALDIIIGKGPAARSVRLDLPRFTLIGATTRMGSVAAPLRDRFGVICHLEFYTAEELQIAS